MNLLRHRPTVTDLHLPNGATLKVEVNDAGNVQHVHDQYDRVHATAVPDEVRVSVRGVPGGLVRTLQRLRADQRATRGRKAFRLDPMGLWAPLPEDVTK